MSYDVIIVAGDFADARKDLIPKLCGVLSPRCNQNLKEVKNSNPNPNLYSYSSSIPYLYLVDVI